MEFSEGLVLVEEMKFILAGGTPDCRSPAGEDLPQSSKVFLMRTVWAKDNKIL